MSSIKTFASLLKRKTSLELSKLSLPDFQIFQSLPVPWEVSPYDNEIYGIGANFDLNRLVVVEMFDSFEIYKHVAFSVDMEKLTIMQQPQAFAKNQRPGTAAVGASLSLSDKIF
jgi:hypothetical protein